MEIYLISLAAALIGGLMLSRVTKLMNLPAVTAYLVAGLILGPFCLGGLTTMSMRRSFTFSCPQNSLNAGGRSERS